MGLADLREVWPDPICCLVMSCRLVVLLPCYLVYFGFWCSAKVCAWVCFLRPIFYFEFWIWWALWRFFKYVYLWYKKGLALESDNCVDGWSVLLDEISCRALPTVVSFMSFRRCYSVQCDRCVTYQLTFVAEMIHCTWNHILNFKLICGPFDPACVSIAAL